MIPVLTDCGNCSGLGEVTQALSVNDPEGPFVACPDCSGEGAIERPLIDQEARFYVLTLYLLEGLLIDGVDRFGAGDFQEAIDQMKTLLDHYRTLNLTAAVKPEETDFTEGLFQWSD
jgi:hypothetical protein